LDRTSDADSGGLSFRHLLVRQLIIAALLGCLRLVNIVSDLNNLSLELLGVVQKPLELLSISGYRV
jgi:hypothetical protein